MHTYGDSMILAEVHILLAKVSFLRRKANNAQAPGLELFRVGVTPLGLSDRLQLTMVHPSGVKPYYYPSDRKVGNIYYPHAIGNRLHVLTSSYGYENAPQMAKSP